MNVSLYQAAAAMNADARWQELISDNLAASSAPGARKQDISFSSVEAGLAANEPGLSGSRFAIPAAHAETNFEQGESRPTGVSTDFAVEGPGFFQVQMPNGQTSYTRDGEFHVSAQGKLVSKQDYPVLGDSGPIQLDPNDSTPMTVSSTGQVSQNGQVRGRIQLMEFKDPKQLTAIGDSNFLANNPAAQPGTAQSSQLHQGYLEGANTSATTEMASLITAMRMFESNSKVLQMQDDRMGRVISDLGGTSS